MSKITKLFVAFLGLSIFIGTWSLSKNLQFSKEIFLKTLQIWTRATTVRFEPEFCSDKSADNGSICKKSTPGCTVFTISKGDQVYFGGNDDYINPDSYYWVDPGNDKRYGAIWIGTPDNVQQGVNEKGLAYDANGLPRFDTNPHLERQRALGGYTYYPIQILHECATVVEVIEWANTHQWHTYMHDQMHFGDSSGDAVIISAGVDGELVFTRKAPGDSFLLSTNFNVANPSNGYPNENYDIATNSLRALLSQESKLTVESVTSVLDDVHSEGGSSWTLESMLADLPNGVIYLYYFYQFDKPVILNVAEEIKNDRPSGPLSALFPEEVRQVAAQRYQRALSSQNLCAPIGKTWVGLVLASLVAILGLLLQKPQRLLFWLPVTIILGPVALLVWLIAGRNEYKSPWQKAVVEGIGHTPPIAVTLMALLLVSLLVPQARPNDLLLILFIFIVPLLVGWLLYQGLFIAIGARKNYVRILGQRLPSAWVATNLGMAGAFAPTLGMVNWLTSTCSMIEISLWSMVSIWVAVVAGVSVGCLIILIYEGWAVHHSFQTWSVLAFAGTGVSIPTWRQIWWWFLLSFPILLAGVIANSLI
jgi:hypothetical protein